jgi:lipopolysaccharide heptosyltransferase II
VKILIVRYSALGDVVLATSVLDPLLAKHPGARVEWVTAPAYAPLLDGLPQLAAVHRLEKGTGAAFALRRALAGQFDVAIDLQNKARSAIVARAAAPRRVVFQRRSFGQAVGSLFGSDPPLVRAHQTELYAEALAELGVEGPGRTHVHHSAQALADAARLLDGVKAPIVALAPGASRATKRWAPERFAAVADALHARGASIVLAGGGADHEAFAAFRAAAKAPVAADLSALSVEGLAAALARADLVVACDSGPVHLAAAAGRPVLAIFGPTSHVRWGPPSPSRVLRTAPDCSPCSNHGDPSCPGGHGHRCLVDLPADAVVAAAREMLATAPPVALARGGAPQPRGG